LSPKAAVHRLRRARSSKFLRFSSAYRPKRRQQLFGPIRAFRSRASNSSLSLLAVTSSYPHSTPLRQRNTRYGTFNTPSTAEPNTQAPGTQNSVLPFHHRRTTPVGNLRYQYSLSQGLPGTYVYDPEDWSTWMSAAQVALKANSTISDHGSEGSTLNPRHLRLLSLAFAHYPLKTTKDLVPRSSCPLVPDDSCKTCTRQCHPTPESIWVTAQCEASNEAPTPPPQDFLCVGCSRRFATELSRLIHINTSATGNHGFPPDEFPAMSAAFLVQFSPSCRSATAAAIIHVPLMYASGPSSTAPELVGYTSGLEASLAAAPHHTETEHASTNAATMDS